MASQTLTSLPKGPSRQSCIACRKRKAKCDRTRPTCELCARMGDRCEYDVKPTVPKSTELAALEDRLQFVEKLLSAQALFLAPFLANIQFDGKMPIISYDEAGERTASSASETGAPLNRSIRAIKRTVESEGKAVTSRADGLPDTPSALAAFYLDLGRRLHQGDTIPTPNFSARQKTFQTRADPLISDASYTTVTNTVPTMGVKRNFHAADLLDLSDQTPAVSPPWINLLDNGNVECFGQDVVSTDELVSSGLMDDLVHQYFEQFYPFLPLIHRPSFLHRIQQPSRRRSLLPVLHSMVSVVLPKVGTPMEPNFTPFTGELLTVEGRDKVALMARKKAMLLAIDRPSVESLQSLLILAVDALGTRALSRGWALIGMLCRMSVQCQVNREFTPLNFAATQTSKASNSLLSLASPAPFSASVLPVSLLHPPNDWVEAETRRRVFWSIVFLDRLASAGTGFHVALNRRDILCKLPAPEAAYENGTEVPSRYTSPLSPFRFRPHPAALEENDDAMEAPLSILGCLAEASEGLGSVQHFMMEAGNLNWKQQLSACQELDGKLKAWRLNLPLEVQTMALDNNGKPNPVALMVHATFNTSIILLNQNFAYPAPTRNASMLNPSKGCLSRCVATTRDMTDLIRFVGHHMPSMNPLLAFCLFVSGRAILVHIKHLELVLPGFGSAGGHQTSSSDLEQFQLHIQALRSISQRWSLGARFADALENAYTTQNSPIAKPSSSESNPVTSARALLDLRLSAFNQGVTGGLIQNSASSTQRELVTQSPKGQQGIDLYSENQTSTSSARTWASEAIQNGPGVHLRQLQQHEQGRQHTGSLTHAHSTDLGAIPLPGMRSRSSTFNGFGSERIGGFADSHIHPQAPCNIQESEGAFTNNPITTTFNLGSTFAGAHDLPHEYSDTVFLGFDAYGMPGEEYGGPAIDWTVFERLLN